jgi:hypothetical protein
MLLMADSEELAGVFWIHHDSIFSLSTGLHFLPVVCIQYCTDLVIMQPSETSRMISSSVGN